MKRLTAIAIGLMMSTFATSTDAQIPGQRIPEEQRFLAGTWMSTQQFVYVDYYVFVPSRVPGSQRGFWYHIYGDEVVRYDYVLRASQRGGRTVQFEATVMGAGVLWRFLQRTGNEGHFQTRTDGRLVRWGSGQTFIRVTDPAEDARVQRLIRNFERQRVGNR